MKKENKVRLKGFTLIELIVVIAVFGILLAAALSILGPVNRIFKSTVSYADGSAMVDNVSKYVEDNLRYSNRLRVYDSVSVGDEGLFVSTYVDSLIDDFFLTNPNKASQKINDEKVYVMKIDNPEISRTDLAGETLDKSYSSTGRISLWVYDVANSAWIDSNGSLSASVVRNKDSAVNPEFYNGYLFTTTLEEGYSESSKDVSNLYLKLNVFFDENRHDASKPYENTHIGNVVSFPLVNLVSNQAIVQESVYFYKTGSTTEVDKDNPQNVFRYDYKKGTEMTTDANVVEGTDIFFVFTKAPHIENY